MKIGNKNFDTKNNIYIMGILNITPDSFSDGGKFTHLDHALFHAETMIGEGVDILDIGGESTRPGYTQISVAEEIERVAPIIEKIKNNFDIPISLDSYKSEVVKANLSYIDMVNDIWGLKYDNQMAKTIAQANLPCCLMHNRLSNEYINFWDDFITDMKGSLVLAKDAGIPSENIILDGGVGFQKTYEQNLSVIKNTDLLCTLGFPVMIATSKKSVIGLTLDKPTDERLYGTIATTVIGAMKGASFMRVHDVGANRDAIKMTKSILEEAKWIQSK